MFKVYLDARSLARPGVLLNGPRGSGLREGALGAPSLRPGSSPVCNLADTEKNYFPRSSLWRFESGQVLGLKEQQIRSVYL